MTLDLLWKGPHSHSHIQRYFSHKHGVYERIQLSIFFVNITVIPVHFYYFIFRFKFYHPIADIVDHIYVLFLRLRKTNTKFCNKNEKIPQRYHLGAASKNCFTEP